GTGRGGPRRPGASHQTGPLLPPEGRPDWKGESDPPRAPCRLRATDLRGADRASPGRPEDRELRPRLRIRRPAHPDRHPRPPGEQPARSRADEDSGGDRTAAHADRADGVLAPHQRVVHPIRERALPTDRPSLAAMLLHPVLPILSDDHAVTVGAPPPCTSCETHGLTAPLISLRGGVRSGCGSISS